MPVFPVLEIAIAFVGDEDIEPEGAVYWHQNFASPKSLSFGPSMRLDEYEESDNASKVSVQFATGVPTYSDDGQPMWTTWTSTGRNPMIPLPH